MEGEVSCSFKKRIRVCPHQFRTPTGPSMDNFDVECVFEVVRDQCEQRRERGPRF